MPSIRRHASSALLVAVLVASILILSQVQASLFTEWTIPTSSSGPISIFVSGSLVYFTEQLSDKIGRLDPSTGVFNEWPLPTGGDPWGIFVDGGLAYFTEYWGNKIGRLSDIGPGTTAVGGFVESVNKLAVLGPWLAVIGLAGCISVVVAVARKRQS